MGNYLRRVDFILLKSGDNWFMINRFMRSDSGSRESRLKSDLRMRFTFAPRLATAGGVSAGIPVSIDHPW